MTSRWSTPNSQARDILAPAEEAGHALDAALRAVRTAMNAMTGGGVLEWGVKKLTGVDLEAEGRKLLLAAVRPIYEDALKLLARMERVIRDYEQVLLDQAEVLGGMPGIVRTDAGPVDLPGDADLRRGALFTSVYGHPPETANDKLMAEALDLQGDDTANKDQNARVIVTHITPVPGAGIVHGSAFIAAHEVFDPRLGSVNDKGDGRGFDANADPSKSRASFYVDYEKGIVVVRQNASHADNGESAFGDPSVGVEQDPQGRVRLRLDASNPLAPPLFQDAKVSVRGDLVIDPHGGSGPAGVNGAVTRFPSWEVYQNHAGRTGEPVLQRHEDDVTRTLGRPFPPYSANTGPAEGLPQPTLPVGQDPQMLDNWRKQFHPGQGNGTGHDLPRNVPELLGDDFYRYGLPNVPYPSVDGTGRVAVPVAGKAG